MNMQTTLAAPITLGQGVVNRSGRHCWAVKIEAETSGIRLMIGGPSPMAEIRQKITIADDEGVAVEMCEHTFNRMRDGRAPDSLNAEQVAALLEKTERRAAALVIEQAQRSAEGAAAREAADAEYNRYKPAWAKGALVAELRHDRSDTMTDYYGSTVSRRVVLAWARHARDLFPEMRKAAALFEETAALADAPENAEHREKYSMGGGFYLKADYRHSDGWKVSKEKWTVQGCPVLEFTDAAKAGLDVNEAAATLPKKPEAPATGHAAGRFEISQHVHTKKGFDMWICQLVDRVERDEFDRLRTEAQSLGGWYSRPWGKTPGGFAFKDPSAAACFATVESAPECTPTRKPQPAPALGDKLRDIADGLQAKIDNLLSDRLSNTPKRARQAGEARNAGREMERTQKMIRALADRHDAGTVPAELVGVKTKAALLDLGKEGFDHSGGYYDSGIGTGEMYRHHDAATAKQAAAFWALLDSGDTTATQEADTLQRKITALQFAKIPGYFPTPAPLIQRMLDAANLSEGARVLEPSAGSGAIADALRDAGHRVECIERHASLCEILAAKGHSVIRGDFLEIGTAGQFDGVVMNPPFENGQDLQHVRRALDSVKHGGVLVAIMGAGVTFRSDSKYADFRSWAENLGGTFEPIEAGAFKESGTGVASVMLTIEKES